MTAPRKTTKKKTTGKAKSKPRARTRAKPSKFVYDKKAAERVIKFIETYCTHIKGEWAGDLIKLEDWQSSFISELFGWKRKSDGTRKYRICYLEIPRKNAKTTIAATFGIYLEVADQEPGAEVYSIAANKEQADIAFGIASDMVESHGSLVSRIEVMKKSLYYKKTMSTFRSLSREFKSKHGLNPHGVIVDELHAHPTGELVETMITGTGSRRQPLVILITTAGQKKEGTPGWEYAQYARKVRDGVIKDDTFLPVIYCADPEDDPFSVKTWKKANPNYGISVKPDYLREAADKAKSTPSYLNTFKRLHLNIWTGSFEAFITPDDWNRGNVEEIHEADFEGQQCIIGIDLASTSDFTAVVCVFKDEDTGLFTCLPHFYIPEESIGRRKNHEVIRAWVDQGFITTTQGDVTDYEVVEEKIRELCSTFDVVELPFDPWNARQFCTKLMEEGFNMIEFRQGFKTMSPAMKETERVILQGKINHGGNPVLAWMNDNLVMDKDPAGNIKPNRKKSADKIDGMVALIMALGRWTLGDISTETATSIYDSDDPEVDEWL